MIHLLIVLSLFYSMGLIVYVVILHTSRIFMME